MSNQNPWVSFLRQNGGKGFSKQELQEIYHNQKGGQKGGQKVGQKGGQRAGGIDDLPVYLQNFVINNKESQNKLRLNGLHVFLLENNHHQILNYRSFPPTLTKAWNNMNDERRQYYKDLAKIANNML
jgi:hypothetical protein